MMALFGSLSLAARAGIIVAVLAAIGGGLTFIYLSIEQRGYDRAINAIAAKDKEAVNAANRAADRVADCRARGADWVWRTSSGDCQRR